MRKSLSIIDIVFTHAALSIIFAMVANGAYSQTNPKFAFRSCASIGAFPSASAMVCRGDKLFVMGDDSRYIMVLGQEFQKLDSIRMFDAGQARVPQNLKADIESGVLIRKKILFIGSSSSPQRHKSYLVSTGRGGRSKIKTLNNRTWLSQSDTAVGPINIEGSFTFNRKLISANRAMKGVGSNFIFVTSLKRFLRGRSAETTLREIILPDSISQVAGISDFCYLQSEDLLLITLSSEDSSNPLVDGAIGKSYLGWISEFSKSFKAGKIHLRGMIDLTALSSAFEGQKIEGVCAQRDDDENLILYLVSDNDDGKSRIFSVTMRRP